MKERQTHIGIANLIISFLVVMGMFVFYRLITDFAFLTNDDMYLQAIVSGELSGAPDAHMIYSNIILGAVLKFLYQCSIQVPWYGIYLVAVCFLCAWMILYRCLGTCSNVFSKIATTVFYLIIYFCVAFRHVAMIQYTVVAAFAGGTAVFYALTMDMKADKKKIVREFIVVLFLAFLSLIIREKVFFMMVPFAAFGWLGKWIAEKNISKKINCRYVVFLISVIILMVCVCATDRIAYRVGENAEAWQEYLRYNKAREQIYDYNLFPDYDLNKDLYKEAGISREAYEGASKYYLLLPQEKINSETMQTVADRSEDNAEADINLKEKTKAVIKEFIQCNLNYADRPMNIVVYAMWLCMIILTLLSKSRNMCMQLVLLFFVRMGMWGYIIWQGRYPDRITQCLYYVELIMLAAFYIINRNVIDNKRTLKYLFLCGAVLIICVPSLHVGINKAIAVKGDNIGKIYWGISYQQLKDYCAEHDDNLYLLDMNSMTFFKSSIFKSPQGEAGVCNNLLPLGSWPNKSPLVDKTLLKYNIQDVTGDLVNNENVYFVFEDSEGVTSQYLLDFYNAELSPLKVGLPETEVLQTDVGINFVFYKLESTQ